MFDRFAQASNEIVDAMRAAKPPMQGQGRMPPQGGLQAMAPQAQGVAPQAQAPGQGGGLPPQALMAMLQQNPQIAQMLMQRMQAMRGQGAPQGMAARPATMGQSPFAVRR